MPSASPDSHPFIVSRDARTQPGERRVSARRGWAGEKEPFFTNLLGGAGVLGQELVYHFLELPLRPGANQLFHDLPVFKE